METKEIKIDELFHLCKIGLQEFGLAPSTIELRLRDIRRLITYMEENKISLYGDVVGKQFYLQTSLAHNWKDWLKSSVSRSLQMLNLIIHGETYKSNNRMRVHEFPGIFGRLSQEYIHFLRKDHLICEATASCYSFILSNLSIYMSMNSITLQTINYDNIINFISSSRNSRPQVVMLIKRFLHHLYDEGKIQTNLSYALVHTRYIKREKLPSYYDKEEILKIESVIDRTSAMGKRDYAIILLASRLGLRASDIVNLTFSDIDWDNNQIMIIQKKTKKEIILPLLSEVGDSIIDYIKNGRPHSNIKAIFLTAITPYRRLSPARISTRFGEYICKAGIETKGRHKGCHSLRHSLATYLLQGQVTLSIISECLGHSSSESTMFYLGIDVKSLQECSLEVPIVEEIFYLQKGGIFYA